MPTRHFAFQMVLPSCYLFSKLEFTSQTAPSCVWSVSRAEMANETGQYQYQKANSFVREPFAVQFQSHKTGQVTVETWLTHSSHHDGSILTRHRSAFSTFCHAAIKKFVLVALHTEPQKAVQEIDRLYDVFEEVVKKWKNNVSFEASFLPRALSSSPLFDLQVLCSLHRTWCSSEISTPAVPTCLGLTRKKSDCSPTQSSRGWSATKWTPPSPTRPAVLMTGVWRGCGVRNMVEISGSPRVDVNPFTSSIALELSFYLLMFSWSITVILLFIFIICFF